MAQLSFTRAVLGSTGLEVGRLGMAASYDAPAAAIERAFDEGVNYLYWGSLRRRAFRNAVRNLRARRDRMVLVVQSYTRVGSLLAWSLERALAALGVDYAEVLLLGLWNHAVPARIVEAAMRARDRGLVRHLGLSTHHRPLVAELAAGSPFDVFHVRYNAVHTGAEREVFPRLPASGTPGVVSFTATCWGRLLSQRARLDGRTPSASDCYRFVLSQPAVDVCLSGPATAEQAAAALEALRLGPMSNDEMTWMRQVGRALYSGVI